MPAVCFENEQIVYKALIFFYLPPFKIGGIKDNLIRLLIVLLLLSFQCRVSQQAGILGFAKSINGTFNFY